MIIAVDFDGTIVENDFPRIGRPYREAFYYLVKWQREGHKIILWTCREGKQLKEAVEFCRNENVEFDAVNENLATTGFKSRKVFADWYVDDRANEMKLNWCWLDESFKVLANASKIPVVNEIRI